MEKIPSPASLPNSSNEQQNRSNKDKDNIDIAIEPTCGNTTRNIKDLGANLSDQQSLHNKAQGNVQRRKTHKSIRQVVPTVSDPEQNEAKEVDQANHMPQEEFKHAYQKNQHHLNITFGQSSDKDPCIEDQSYALMMSAIDTLADGVIEARGKHPADRLRYKTKRQTCDGDMESIAEQDGCSRQYINVDLHEIAQQVVPEEGQSIFNIHLEPARKGISWKERWGNF